MSIFFSTIFPGPQLRYRDTATMQRDVTTSPLYIGVGDKKAQHAQKRALDQTLKSIPSKPLSPITTA